MLKKIVLAFMGLALVAALSGPADADELPERMDSLSRLLEQKRYLEAYEAARAVEDAIWEELDFQVSFAGLAEEKPENYSLFTPRRDAAYAPGEEIFAYLELIGYAFEPAGQRYRLNVAVDLNILDTAGKVLAGQRDFGQFALELGDRSKEFFLNLTVTLSSAPPGDYILEFVVHDKVGGETASTQLPVTIG